MPLSYSNKVSTIKPASVSEIFQPFANLFKAPASTALDKKINPSAIIPPLVKAPTPAPTPAKKAAAPVAAAAPKSIAPAAQNNSTTFQTPPAYDAATGLLTDYGKSQGMPEINGKKSAYVPPSTAATGAGSAAKNTPAAKETPSFGGILFDLLQKATNGNQNVQQAREDLTKFQTGTAQKIADIKSQPIPLEFQQGRAQVVQQASAEKEKALQTGVSNALEQQQQELTALGAAAGQTAPIQVPYSNQVIDPVTGLPVGGGATGANLTDSVASVAEKVKNGSMGYDAGVDALKGYGQAGVNELQKALGPNFNIQQSNATAAAQEASTLQTGTLGGQLQKQAETVKTHMGTLKTAYDQLGAKYGIPLLNAGINAIAKQFGSGPLQSYNIALSNVRDELAKILGGGTSTDGTRATAAALLPDNMTPAQIDAAIKTATELMNAKIEEYTKIPQFNNNGATGGGTGGQYDW